MMVKLMMLQAEERNNSSNSYFFIYRADYIHVDDPHPPWLIFENWTVLKLKGVLIYFCACHN